jgi:hypothetical protein
MFFPDIRDFTILSARKLALNMIFAENTSKASVKSYF